MNANELAGELDKYKGIATRDAATMLRQQQAEIEALKDSSYEKGFIDGMAQMTESAVHRAVEGMAVKELTDEEITAIWYEPTLRYDPVAFARAILRKAQKK